MLQLAKECGYYWFDDETRVAVTKSEITGTHCDSYSLASLAWEVPNPFVHRRSILHHSKAKCASCWQTICYLISSRTCNHHSICWFGVLGSSAVPTTSLLQHPLDQRTRSKARTATTDDAAIMAVAKRTTRPLERVDSESLGRGGRRLSSPRNAFTL